MEAARIAELLQPFCAEVQPALVEQLRSYLDLLLRWNARMNLTAVRDAESIVTRHFGESLFAARKLMEGATTLADVGSGAGFPGVPMKLFAPRVEVTLIESQNKKATFLREVVRTLELDGIEVFCGRAEQWGKTAEVVTLRAVEQFARALPVAAKLVTPGGRLGLLIGAAQADEVCLLEGWRWLEPLAIPRSEQRVVMVGRKGS